MARVTIRQRNQLTVPGDIAQQAGISPGTVCDMSINNGIITIAPITSGARDWRSYVGCAPDAWGSTPEAVEQQMREDRASWDQ